MICVKSLISRTDCANIIHIVSFIRADQVIQSSKLSSSLAWRRILENLKACTWSSVIWLVIIKYIMWVSLAFGLVLIKGIMCIVFWVWIVGHSIVFWADTYVASSGWDSNLRLGDCLHLTWLGHKQIHWIALLSAIFHWGPPDSIIIQLGKNDLPEQKGVILAQPWLLTSRLCIPGSLEQYCCGQDS